MAKRNTKTVEHKIPIPRSYDPMAMEERIYKLEKAGSTPAPTPEERNILAFDVTNVSISSNMSDELQFDTEIDLTDKKILCTYVASSGYGLPIIGKGTGTNKTKILGRLTAFSNITTSGKLYVEVI